MISNRTLPGLTLDYGQGPQPLGPLTVPVGSSIPSQYARIAQNYLKHATQHTPRAELARLWGPSIMHALLAAGALGLPDVNAEEPNREMKEYGHFMLRWGLNGCPNFQVSHSLEASLLLTDCAKVRANEVKFPFPSFLVSLPSPNSALSLQHPDGRTEPARWILFHTLTAPAKHCQDAAWDHYTTEIMHRRMRTNADVIALMTELETSYDWITMSVIRLVTESGLNVFRRAPWPGDDQTLETWVGGTDEIFTGLGMLEMTEADTRCTNAAYRICANLALYLSARLQAEPNLLVKKTPKHPRRDSDPGNPITTFTVGQEVKLSREVREAAHDMMQRGSHADGWTLKSRHVVRGHWKQQVKGPGRVDRQRIWVQPYWRGEDLTTAVSRQYSVGQPKGDL